MNFRKLVANSYVGLCVVVSYVLQSFQLSCALVSAMAVSLLKAARQNHSHLFPGLTSYFIRRNSTLKTFFNRTKELQFLYDSLKGRPKFLVVSGPVHSGKTALLKEVQKELKKNKPCPSAVSLNLKNRTFRDVDAFSYHITEELNSWWKS